MSELRLHMSDVRAAKLCTRGTRALFVRHGIDYNAFLRDGMPVEQAEATGNAMVLTVTRMVREREAAKEASNG